MGKILAIVIGLALAAFIIGEVARTGSSLTQGSRNEIGEVGGEAIGFEQYNKKVETNTNNFLQQSGQAATPQITGYIQETTWNELVSQIILKKEIEKLGIAVGEAETKDMIQGSNPNPQIVQAFGNPQTRELDRSRLNSFLTSLKSAKADDPMKVQWKDFVTQMVQQKRTEKYLALVRNGLYVNSLDAKDDYEAKNKLVNFKYAELSYASLPDAKVTLTDGDYSDYYNKHKSMFKNSVETRSFDYVTFNASPSAEDSVAVKEQVAKLAADFKTAANDSLFVQINADTKAPLTYQRKGQLDPAIDSVMFSAAKGIVYGPYLSNGSYKVAKLVDSRVGPDSVKASHILINPATEGGLDKAQAKADSIKKLISGGASFAELANKYSTDTQSGAKGGDLGTFGRGAMVGPFDEAVFNGKPGDLTTVNTQFGVHIIKIESQKGSSKVVKVAVVDKPLQASSKTQSAAYSKAQGFLASIKGDNYTLESQKQGLRVERATDVTPTANAVTGLDNARDIVRWAYKADIGDVPDQVYTIGSLYVVPRLAEIRPEGYLPVDAVKKQIEVQVRNAVKAKTLTTKFEGALSGASSIDAVAQKIGTNAVPVENIVFANPVLPGLSAEYEVVGTLFGLPVHKLSKPIAGQHGVFVVYAESFTNPPALTNTVNQKQSISQTLLQRADNSLFEALKDKANVKDNRGKFL
ncbi:SurA N-terminal domain-containing protein [Mucilaginibacter myungsuensis]